MSSLPLTLQPPRTSFLRSLVLQARVVGALMLRELHTRYGRENVGYLWMIGEPMILASVIGLVHSRGHTNYGSDIRPVPFAVVGYTCFILFRGIVNRSEGSLEANGPLLYHKQVTILDLTVARALLEFCGCFSTFVALMTLLCCAGLAEPPVRPLALIGAWMLMFWYSLGHSLVITGVTHENRTIGRLVHPYSYFMVFLSGAFSPIGWLPHPLREWMTYIPITGVFELARYGQFNAAKPTYFYPLYLIASCAILTWCGLIAIRKTRAHIHL